MWRRTADKEEDCEASLFVRDKANSSSSSSIGGIADQVTPAPWHALRPTTSK